MKITIQQHKNRTQKSIYHLKGGEKKEFPFSKFVHANGTVLAAAIKECWMEPMSMERLPKDRVLVVGGPDYTTIKLQNGSVLVLDYIVESTHIHADTRLLLHVTSIRIDQEIKCCVNPIF